MKKDTLIGCPYVFAVLGYAVFKCFSFCEYNLYIYIEEESAVGVVRVGFRCTPYLNICLSQCLYFSTIDRLSLLLWGATIP